MLNNSLIPLCESYVELKEAERCKEQDNVK